MKLKRILLFGIVMIFMTGTLATEAATTQSSPALEPWTKGVIDWGTGTFLGQHVSIDHYERNGRAYISYYDATHGNLKLAYEVLPGTGNCPGNADWKCDTVDSGFIFMGDSHDVGQYSSIDVIDDTTTWVLPQGDLNLAPILYHYAKIGISYYDDTDNALKFALWSCESSNSCSWAITEIDDDTGTFPDSIGQYSSFHFGSDDTPVIYYRQYNSLSSSGKVRQAYLTGTFSGHCGAGWHCETVAQSLMVTAYGTHISADGNSVAYYDGGSDQLMLATPSGTGYGSGCGITNYWNCVVIDNGGLFGDVGKFVSLHAGDASHPTQMAYYDAVKGKVKYAVGTTGTGNCTNNNFNCFAVDTIGTTTLPGNIGLSLTMDLEGAPIIAYQDFSDEQGPAALKIARPAGVYGNVAGNCGEVPPGPGNLFLFWQCKFLDAGQYSEMADYAAVSVSPAGLATVAYYEFATLGDYSEVGRLKVAQQHFTVQLPLIMK